MQTLVKMPHKRYSNLHIQTWHKCMFEMRFTLEWRRKNEISENILLLQRFPDECRQNVAPATKYALDSTSN